MDRAAVHAELNRAQVVFHELLDDATAEELRRPSNGTRWTNRQLLFHMLLGYLIMWALLLLVRIFDRLPPSLSRSFARLLNAATTPFDAVNYAGSWLGGSVLRPRQMATLFDLAIKLLHRQLDRESDTSFARGMHYPTRWDPFFKDYMTLADLYRFPTQHFHFHRRQLTIGPTTA